MATPALSFDPGACSVVFNGVQLHGFAPGTFIKAARDEDAFNKQIGADGEVARIRNRNRGGTVEVTLIQTSLSNDVLSAQAALDEAGGGGNGSLQLKDGNGSTLITARAAWVKKMADTEWGKELTTRTWVFDTGELVIFVGGNAT